MKNKELEFAIIGAGRFGLFWGKQLAKLYPVSFYDIDDTKKELAESIGKWQELTECLKKPFIFLTTPIRNIEEFLKQNGSKMAPGSIIIDCASVKIVILEWLERHIPEKSYYIGCHPLFGPDSAKDSLNEQSITLIPGRVPYHKYNTLVNIFSNQLHLNVLTMSAKEHDNLMAYNLCLIHHLGRTFSELQIYKLPLMMAALQKINGIADVVTNDSDELFEDFYRFNPFAKDLEREFLAVFKGISPTRKP
jgi:prephenate dehydrogenase